MKKAIMMVVAAMLSTMSVHAQDYKHNEISAAYGFGSNTDLITSLFKGAFTGKQLDYWDLSAWSISIVLLRSSALVPLVLSADVSGTTVMTPSQRFSPLCQQ